MPESGRVIDRVRQKILRTFGDKLLASPVRTADVLARCRTGPVVVAGLMRTASGIGEAARACSAALTEMGVAHDCVDLSPHFGQVDMPAVQPLTAFPAAKHGTLLLHLNAPETRSGLAALGLTRGRHWRIAGHWVWELETAPDSWRAETRHLSEIWTPSAFSARALARLSNLPVRVVPHRVIARPDPPAPAHAQFGLSGGERIVLAMMDSRSSFARKNLDGTLSAYIDALGDHTGWRLVIKTRNLEESLRGGAASPMASIANHPRVTVIDASLAAHEHRALMSVCDIFLSLHRAEGFGLTIAEAMALGKPVVATGWSANMEFMDDTSALPVAFKLVPVVDPAGIYPANAEARWAEPDHASAVTALRRLADDERYRSALGAAARQAITAFLGPHAYLTALDAGPGN